MVKYVCDDNGEKAKEKQCSAGIHHRVEHRYRDGRRVWEIRHFLENKKDKKKVFRRVIQTR